MEGLRFEWDRQKESQNLRKHGVSFEEAATVFLDEHALLIADPEHSEDEDRFILLGLSTSLKLLVVVHCYRESDEVVRLITARRASRPERRQYDQRWKR
jgi:uncharacterized DUF497 family protein